MTASQIVGGPSPGDRISEAERGTRRDLAASYHLADLYGWSDLTASHISAKVPGEADAMLIASFPSFFDQVAASDLVKIDFDGKDLSGTDRPLNPAGVTIHGAVQRARPDVQCVIHTHSVAGMAVSALDCGLLPITQHALLFYDNIGYHAYGGIADDLEEGQRIVRDLAQNQALVLRNHGLLVAGRSVPHAFKLMYYLEKSCQAQLAAMAAANGAEVVSLSPEVCRHAAEQYAGLVNFGEDDWPGHLQKLDELGSRFRN